MSVFVNMTNIVVKHYTVLYMPVDIIICQSERPPERLMIFHWSFIEKTPMKQAMKCKVCSIFQMYTLVEASSGQEQYYISQISLTF